MLGPRTTAYGTNAKRRDIGYTAAIGGKEEEVTLETHFGSERPTADVGALASYRIVMRCSSGRARK